jgi:hypothetical protein
MRIKIMPNKMKPAKLDDGSKINAFKLLKLIGACADDLSKSGESEGAYYFSQLYTWLEEDVFGKGVPMEYSNMTLGL